MLRWMSFGFVTMVAFLAPDGHAAPSCALTIRELKALMADASFPLKWRETTMDDGRPLVLSLLERNGALYLEFVKTGDGLWAESAIVVCPKGSDIEASFTAEQVRLGPAANFATQLVFANGGQFTLTRLGAEQLRVATTGWSGTFSSNAAPAKATP